MQIVGSNRILMKKYREYLVPSILTTLSLAFNEFVDTMLVSNLLGNDALSIVNMTMPIIFIQAACFLLIGSGGAILYAVSLGKWNSDKAGKYFSVSLMMAVGVSVGLVCLGLLLNNQIINLLCVNPAIKESYRICYFIQMCSSPAIIILNAMLCFMPSCGVPAVATIVNIVTNCVNLLMDIVFIRIFDTGVSGAYWATLTGQAVGIVVLVILIKWRSISIVRSKISLSDIQIAGDICKHGAATSVLQIFYAFKVSINNQLAQKYGGADGVIAFSLCLQTFSISSVFLLGIADTAQPLLALLSGQKDYRNERTVFIRSLWLQVIFSSGLIIVYMLFPGILTTLYGVDGQTAKELGMHGIRLFAFTYLPRAICIQNLRYHQVEHNKGYALAISLFDGIALIPISIILAFIIGIDGVFLCYPITAVLMLIMIVITNIILYNKKNGEYSSPLLIRKEEQGVYSNNYTITYESGFEEISQASISIIAYCKDKGIPEKMSMHVGLLSEEMALYTVAHKQRIRTIDILLRIMDDAIELCFRSIGEPFDPTSRMECDKDENITLLHKISSGISYEYVMGMNNTKILIKR